MGELYLYLQICLELIARNVETQDNAISCQTPEISHIAVLTVGHTEFECITDLYINEVRFILYLDEKLLPCIDVARKQNHISNVTRDGYTMKMQYGLALNVL